MAGLYIHIPFCKSRCIYCGFYSSTLDTLKEAYVNALCHELIMRKDEINSCDTVYLGGGTPSQLSINQLEKIFTIISQYYLNKKVVPSSKTISQEITIECNPDDINPDFAHALSMLPVNRVSMGAQTFDDTLLKFIHRRHTARQAQEAVNLLRHTGIPNISIDLMYGFPNETLTQWKTDIYQAIKLDVNHISAYSLMYEEGTPLYNMQKRGDIQEIDEELSLSMYETLVTLLSGAGYEHYEISNFAQKGYRSRHNSSYWQNVPYIGVGAAAHSYNLQTRSWNVSDIKQYIESINKNIRPYEEEILTNDMKYNDLITTTLRTKEGLNFAMLPDKYRKYLLSTARPHITQGNLIIERNHIHLTQQGIFISDDIMSDLIYL